MSSAARFVPRLLALAVVGMLILGACTSSTEGSAAASSAAASSSAAAESSDAPESQAASGDATVTTADSDHGEILTDAEGMTIYFFANDTEGVSNCSGDCLANWPIVPVDGEPTGDDGVTAELGTIDAEDGTQLTVNGFPAYYFAGDSEAGDTNGQAVGGVWWVFGADGEPIEEE